jgi:zinc protease
MSFPPLMLAAAAAVAAPAMTSSLAAQDSAAAALGLHRDVLDNGLEVLVVENHLSPLTTVLVAVRNGAFTQQPDERGLAHLFEHLLFRTYGRDPSAFGQAVAELDGRYNGSTDQEVVTYWVMVPSRRAKHAVEILGRLLTRARFGRDVLEEERRVVLDEIARARSDPEQSLDRQVEERLWGAALHRHDVAGDSASLAGLTLERLQATFERYYVPNNAAVIVTGDVSAPEMLRDVERRFRDWKRAPDPFADTAVEPAEAFTGWRATLVADPRVRDVTVTVALHGPSLVHDTAATYGADALLAILNEPSSRFQRYLVATGRYQWLTAGYRTLRGTGPITFRGKTTAEQAADAVRELMSILTQPEFLLDLDEEDLTIARKARELDVALAFEAGAELAPRLASWWATAGMAYYQCYGDRLDAQTVSDLERFARRYLIGRPGVAGVLGPPDAVDRVAQWLRASAGPRQ